MHKLKHVVTGVMLALVACGPLAMQAHAAPHEGSMGRDGGWHGGDGWRGDGGWRGGWGWGGWGGYYAGAAMGAAAASASYQAAPEIYNATGNNAPEDDSIYDRDLSTLVNTPAAPAKPRPTCQAGQVYNDLTESCDRP